MKRHARVRRPRTTRSTWQLVLVTLCGLISIVVVPTIKAMATPAPWPHGVILPAGACWRAPNPRYAEVDCATPAAARYAADVYSAYPIEVILKPIYV